MPNFYDIQIIIMAGGVGSRFWPMSTPDYPRQFIDVMGVGRSLIKLTVDRLKPICPVENMWVVTNEKSSHIVKEQIPDMPVDNILAEPEARNTAPCIAYACWKIQKKHPDAKDTYNDKVIDFVKQHPDYEASATLVSAVDGLVLPVSNEPGSDIEGGCIIERPKVLYNQKTRKHSICACAVSASFHFRLVVGCSS